MAELTDSIILALRDFVLPLFAGFIGAWFLIKLKERTEYKRAYRAFFHEVKQNISHALHNMQILKGKKVKYRLVTFRDDVWIWSKKTGYFTKFSKELQNSLFDLYLKQYVVGELVHTCRDIVGGEAFRERILKETKDELLPMLRQAKKDLQSKIEP